LLQERHGTHLHFRSLDMGKLEQAHWLLIEVPL
jgi:hypothetical protein